MVAVDFSHSLIHQVGRKGSIHNRFATIGHEQVRKVRNNGSDSEYWQCWQVPRVFVLVFVPVLWMNLWRYRRAFRLPFRPLGPLGAVLLCHCVQ